MLNTLAVNKPKILFYVQHLLGIGHIKRASLLVNAWNKAGLDVTVVSGGEPVEHFGFGEAKVIQLPPVKSVDASFSGLVDSSDTPIDDNFKHQRCQRLINGLLEVRPDVLIIENYPFGRRQLRWELNPLLQQASKMIPRPLICSSVRDILQGRKSERITETLELIDQYFDAVLVHGDADFIRLEDSFPKAEDISAKVRYTGYVANPVVPYDADDNAGIGKDEVVVSAGGGAVGFQLMKTALASKPLSSLNKLTWRFLLGPNLSEDERQQLRVMAGDNCILEPVRSDFPELLANCRLSISQAGYNTVMDLLQARCSSILVPFEGVGETEQLTRTARLSDLGLCTLVTEQALDVFSLTAAIDQAINREDSTTDRLPAINLDGAGCSVTLLLDLWQQHLGSSKHV